MTATASAATAPVAASRQPAKPADLIVNGNFESPSIWQAGLFTEFDAGSTALTGWSIGGSGVDLVGKDYWQPAAGDQSLDLSGSAPGSISQVVRTTPGTAYTLAWFMAGNTNCGQPVKAMHVLWDGKLITAPAVSTSGDSSTSMGWIEFQIVVTAAGKSSTVGFADATADQSECGAALDDVSLVTAQIAHPKFTQDSPALATLEGSPYSAVFFASGVPSYKLAGAPSWLSIDPYGAVTGTPPSGTATFTYSVSASNADGSAIAGPYTVRVESAATVTGTVVDGGIASNPVAGAPV